MPKEIIINATWLRVEMGKTKAVIANLIPDNTTYPEMTWTSSDESIFIVDNSGLITPKQVGSAELIVTCQDVSTSVPVNIFCTKTKEIYFNRNTIPKFIAVGEEIAPSLIFNPSNASLQDFELSCNNDNIIVKGGTRIVALKIGKTTITATTAGLTASVTLYIYDKELTIGLITAILIFCLFCSALLLRSKDK